MLKFMENLLDESNDFDKLSSDAKAMADLLAKTPVCVIGSMNFVWVVRVATWKIAFNQRGTPEF